MNPYIAMSDLMINMVMTFAFISASMTVVGRLGSDDIKYKKQRETISQQILESVTSSERPEWIQWKNDPAGVQRWKFPAKTLFEGQTDTLSASGRRAILAFATVLNDNKASWTRLRIEGHSIPPLGLERDDWTPSALRANAVANVLSGAGRIRANFIVVSGKGGQDPIVKRVTGVPPDPSNNRVEIIIEFGKAKQG